jgi:DNA repair protein RadA/Sms
MGKSGKQGSPGLTLVSSRNYVEITYACMACGEKAEDNSSLCPGCGAVNSMAPEEIKDDVEKDDRKRRRAKPASSFSKLKVTPIPTGRAAWNEVLGGGLVKPSSILIHGPKGTGKTTAMLEIATKVARKLGGEALYGSAEMSGELLRHYAERAGLDMRRLLISDAGDAENMLQDIEDFEPVICVWDSVQAFTWEGALGETELRNVIRAGIGATSEFDVITMFVSQVTKDNDFLGPSELGHGVDVVVTLARKPDGLLISCDEKNRFAPTPRTALEKNSSDS